MNIIFLKRLFSFINLFRSFIKGTCNKIRYNCVSISILIFFSFLFFFIVLPHIKIKTDIEYIILLTGFSLIIVSIFFTYHKKLRNYCKKYSATFKVKNPPFTLLDCIITVILISTLYFLFNKTDFSYLLKILDYKFLIIFISTLIIVILILLLPKEQQDTKETKTDSIKYEPIEDIREDKLGRKKFINDFNEIICKNLDYDESSVIGLTGAWGDGKTSVINCFINEINSKNNSKQIIVKFNPLCHENEEAILRSFYNHIESEISKKYIIKGLHRTLRTYVDSLLKGIEFKGLKISPFYKIQTPSEIKSELEKILTDNDVKLIIIIDDIDRLNYNEITLIFSLIRFNTNFRNTLFIVCYDPEYLNKVFEKEFTSVSNKPEQNIKDFTQKYIEKIFKISIPLPEVEYGKLREYLLSIIKELLTDKSFEKYNIPKSNIDSTLEYFNTIFTVHKLEYIFTNLRAVNKYLSHLSATLPSIIQEVDILDYLLLEIIKTFNYELYKDIWENSYYYNREWSKLNFKQSIDSEVTEIIDEKEHYEISMKYLLNKLKSSNEKLYKLYEKILSELFPDTVGKYFNENTYVRNEYTLPDKRIKNPDYFEKYFILQVPLNEISDQDTKMIINNLEKENQNKYDTIDNIFLIVKKDGKLNSLFIKLRTNYINTISLDTAETLIKWIYTNADSFSFSKTPNILIESSEFRNAINLTEQLIEQKIPDGQKKDTFIEIINKSESYLFINELIKLIICLPLPNYPLISNSVSNDEKENLKKMFSDRLYRYYIEEKHNILKHLNAEYSGLLFFWLRNWVDYGKNEHRDEIIKYVMELINDDSESFIIFLKPKYIPEKDENLRSYTSANQLNDISYVFNLHQLSKIAQKHIKSTNLTEEDKKYLQMFIKDIEEYTKNKNKEKETS